MHLHFLLNHQSNSIKKKSRMPPVKFSKREKIFFLYFFVIQKGKREKKRKKMFFFNLFDVSVCFIDFGLMTQQDGRIVKKRIGSRFVEKSKTRKRELENKRKCFIFIKLDCHFDEIRFDRIHPGDVNGITWVMGKTLAISQTENRRENYWTSSNQRKCSGKKSYIFFKKTRNFLHEILNQNDRNLKKVLAKRPFSKMSD